MRFNDTISGAVIIAFAATMIALAQRFPGFPGQNYGPALFPTLIGICLVVCGVVLMARGHFDRRIKGEPWIVRERVTGRDAVSFLLVMGVTLCYILFSDTAGFIASSVAVLLVLYAAFGVKWRVGIPVALGFTLAAQYLFVHLLRIPLPRGWLDSIL